MKFCKYCYEELNNNNHHLNPERNVCDDCVRVRDKLIMKYRIISIVIGIVIYVLISFVCFLILKNSGISYIIVPSLILIIIISQVIAKNLAENATQRAAKERTKNNTK